MITQLYSIFFRSFVVLCVALLSVNYLPDKLFHDFPFNAKTSEPVNFDSVIVDWNSKLSDNSPEYIQLNQILGPESIAVSAGGLIYTGLADGRIVELDPNKQYKLRQVLRFNPSPKCKDNDGSQNNLCGRFLQMRFLNDTLYSIEGNHGLYKIDTKTGTKSLVGPKKLYPVSMYNSFTFDPKEPNIVYITVSSTRWQLQQILWSSIELDSSGTIMAMDTVTGKRVTVLDNLMIVNGIDVDTTRDQLVFTETFKSKVNTLSLKDVRAAFKQAKDGDKLANIGKTELIPIMPGLPDNIVIDGDHAYIALPFVKIKGNEFIDRLASMPNVRQSLARLVFGAGKVLQYVNDNLYNHPILEDVYRELVSGHIFYKFASNGKSGIIVYNLATKVTKLYGSDHFAFLSEAVPDGKGNLLLGSFRNLFMVKVKIPK